jgi:UDP-N-acetylglucosamine 2-epimerase (non-hydrolysing)
MLIDIIAGARPNFIKISPIIDAIKVAQNNNIKIYFRLIHTGQHYDKIMSGDFFEELNIPKPNINLNAGGGTQAEQTAAIMLGYEKVLLDLKPDLTLVVGDVTSTMACAISAQKMQVKVAHVEAGIRSGDWNMPEEINRLITDSITNFYFTTTELANNNLIRSGISKKNIFLVGNTMIDTLKKHRSRFKKPVIWEKANLKSRQYFIVTLHRPSNVDDQLNLKYIIEEIHLHAKNLPIIFPVHPRTAKILQSCNLSIDNLYLIEPLSYLEFNYLVENSKAVITDSGGITEETSYMGIPCMTLRDTTERPETINYGTNELIGIDPKNIAPFMKRLFDSNWKACSQIPFWDGHSSERIVNQILNLYSL